MSHQLGLFLTCTQQRITYEKKNFIKIRSKSLLAGIVIMSMLGGVNVQGASIWNIGGNGNSNGNWNTAGNWNPNGIPDAEGAEVAFTNNITANRTINLSSNVTIGSLTAGDPTAAPSYNNFVMGLRTLMAG